MLALFSELFSLICIEIVLKYFVLIPPHHIESDLFLNVRDSNIGYVNAPHLDIAHSKGQENEYFEHYYMSIQTDARGYRVLPGYKIPQFKSKGIVGVGDSIMFGLGVDGEETSLARLMIHCRIPIINLGVSGYNTKQ